MDLPMLIIQKYLFNAYPPSVIELKGFSRMSGETNNGFAGLDMFKTDLFRESME